MFTGIFDEVLSIVKEWQPKKEYRSETGYRDDLIAFIRKELKKGGGIWGPPRRHRIRKESGRHLADIGIDEKIGIELKRNLRSQSQLDRLMSQIRRFKRSYDYVIVVLCGETREELADDLQVEFGARGLGWGQPETVVIVRKGKREEKKGRPKGWVNLFEEI